MRTTVIAAMCMACVVGSPRTVWAQDPIHKAGRGAVNVLTGWIEVPKNFSLGVQEDNPVLGAAWGLLKGLGLTATRLVIGAYEAVTCPLPYPRGYASPYESLELSDYPWE
jgi:putative exosortase-associated protein (TIGR04073 family)